MNAIEANQRLDILTNAVSALEYAIEEAGRRADVYGRHALRTIREELIVERDELHAKLSEVSI